MIFTEVGRGPGTNRLDFHGDPDFSLILDYFPEFFITSRQGVN